MTTIINKIYTTIENLCSYTIDILQIRVLYNNYFVNVNKYVKDEEKKGRVVSEELKESMIEKAFDNINNYFISKILIGDVKSVKSILSSGHPDLDIRYKDNLPAKTAKFSNYPEIYRLLRDCGVPSGVWKEYD